MAISTAGIFTAVVLNIVFAAVLFGSAYGAGLNDSKKDSPSWKAAVSFAGISSIAISISILVIIYKAIVSNDYGAGGGSRR